MVDKKELHIKFWQGKGPSLILIPPSRMELYDLDDYPARFYDPHAMWESEMQRARVVVDWPTDGIPTVRSNLGVITLPAMVGLPFSTPDNSMPWPGKPLSKSEIRTTAGRDIRTSEIFRLVAGFYDIHKKSGEHRIAPYLPDTQGVFDIAHLLFGDEILLSALEDEGSDSWFAELMEISLDLFVRATQTFKTLVEEEKETMIHGHGTEQGIFFPYAGARVAEDTAILLSPEMIERSVIPVIQQSLRPFGGGFLHFCGYHPTFFDQVTVLPEVKAIDLGNPESYHPVKLLERCAETGTVLHSRIAQEPGEDWRTYIQRIGTLVAETGARVILRPTIFPDSKAECREMQQRWHEITVW